MRVVVGHEVDEPELEVLELRVGADFELAIVHLAGLVEDGSLLGYFGLLVMVLNPLRADHAGVRLVQLEAEEADVLLALGGVGQDLAPLLLLALVAYVAGYRHRLQLFQEFRLALALTHRLLKK